MKSTKYQLLKSEYDSLLKDIKLYKETIDDLRKQNKMLIELSSDQYKTLKFINKVMHETTKHQFSLSKEEKNFELLDLSWSTNDIISDNPRQMELIEILKTQGIDVTSR